MGCHCSNTLKLSVLASIGILLGLAGAIFYGIFPKVYRDQIAKKSVIEKSNKEVFDNWKSSPVPVHFKIYFFNVTNPDEVKRNTSKPYLKEVGPYYFVEKREKEDIKFGNDGKNVSYSDHKTYTFDESLSSGSLDDYILTVNAPYVGIAKKIQHFPLLIKGGFNGVALLHGEDLFMTKTVRELAFEGYKEPLVDFIQTKFGLNLIPNATFGFFHKAKSTPDDTYSINTGKSDTDKFAMIEEWDGKKELTFWKSPYCNMLNGTDGSMFPPSVSKDDTLYTFSTDLCRSLYLKYELDNSHHGIDTYRFIAPKELFADPDTYAPNECYCPTKPCFGQGLLDISTCKKAPVVMSSPHFYQCAKKYQDAVDGLKPEKDKHETLLDVEPITGAVMNAAKRVQINIHVEPSIGTVHMEDINEIVFPVLWVEEGATIDEKSAEKFKNLVYKPKNIAHAVVIALVVVGCVILVIAIICVVVLHKKNTKSGKQIHGEVNYGMKYVSK